MPCAGTSVGDQPTQVTLDRALLGELLLARTDRALRTLSWKRGGEADGHRRVKLTFRGSETSRG